MTISMESFFHSVQLQVICDADLLCIDAFVVSREEHMMLVSCKIALCLKMQQTILMIFPRELSPPKRFCKYPLLKWLLTPFKNHGNLTRDQTCKV